MFEEAHPGRAEKEAVAGGVGRALVIASSVFAGAITSQGVPQGPLSATERGQMIGRGIVVLAGIITGIVLIVLHFTRSRRG